MQNQELCSLLISAYRQIVFLIFLLAIVSWGLFFP
jgi:hypothetical protein